MNYILRICTRCRDLEEVIEKRYAFKTYEEACKRMVEELEKLNRQIMATDLTDVTGYTLILNYWVGGKKFKKVAVIEYDLAL